MKRFEITVRGIERKEYYDACQENGRRLYAILGASMVVICGAIILFTGDVTIASILWPAGIYLAIIAGYTLLTRLSYKDQLSALDPPIEYEFDGGRWRMRRGDQTAEIEWKATPKLRRTKRCLFLYNDEVSGNLIPLRLLTEGQAAAIETSFKNSRPQAKAYFKKKNREERQHFRDTHPGLRLGRSGPAWGPRKRK